MPEEQLECPGHEKRVVVHAQVEEDAEERLPTGPIQVQNCAVVAK